MRMWRTPGWAAKALAISGWAARQWPHQEVPNSSKVGPVSASISLRAGSGRVGLLCWAMVSILAETLRVTQSTRGVGGPASGSGRAPGLGRILRRMAGLRLVGLLRIAFERPVTTSDTALPSESVMSASFGATGAWRQASSSSSQSLSVGPGGRCPALLLMEGILDVGCPRRASGIPDESGTRGRRAYDPAHVEGTAARAPDDVAMTPPPRRRVRGLRLGIAVVFALLALPLIALLSHPWWLADYLSSYLSETSGREVRFDKVRLGLGDSLTPKATFEGVHIANAPWSDASRPFAVLRQASFQLAWHRHDGRWLVTRMILSDGEVHLHRQADGRRNWRLRDPEDRGPGRFWFQGLEPHRIALSFVHDAGEFVLRSRASDLALATDKPSASDGAALVNRIDFDGRWRGMAFAGRADAGPEITFFDSGRWFPLRGQATFAGIRLEADGRAADLFRGLKIDAATTANGNSLAGLRPLIGPRPAEPRVFRAEGRLLVDEAVYAMKGARAKVGGTDLAGDVAWSRRDERPR